MCIRDSRADACSHYGVARDLYAYLIQHGKQATLQRPSVDAFKVENHDLDIEVTVENSEACPHYALSLIHILTDWKLIRPTVW